MFNEGSDFLNKKKDSRVLPEDFKLPDFNLSKENRVMPEERFKINHNGQKWNCILNLERCDTNDEDNLFGKEGDVVLKIYDSENEEEVAGFTAVVIKNINHERGGSPELNNVNFLSITSRMIRSDYRREKTGKKSFFEKGIKMMEEVASKINEGYSDLDIQYVENYTCLGKVAKLLLDQQWLREHGLDEYLKNDGDDMGYVPDEKDVDTISTVLKNRLWDMSDDATVKYKQNAGELSLPKIRLLKKI